MCRSPTPRTKSTSRTTNRSTRRAAAIGAHAADDDRVLIVARPSAIQRASVVFDTPQLRAAARTEPPGIAIAVGALRGSPQTFPLRPGPLEPGLDALRDAGALSLCNLRR